MARQHVEGLKDLEKNLRKLSHATQRNVLRRVGKNALTPVIDEAEGNAPELSGALKSGALVTTKRPRGVKSENANRFRRAKRFGASTSLARTYANGSSEPVTIYGGFGMHPQAMQQELGNENHAPQPFLRPAWDKGKSGVLAAVKRGLKIEIDKSLKRLAAKRARGR